jgi:hypothetical protein
MNLIVESSSELEEYAGFPISLMLFLPSLTPIYLCANIWEKLLQTTKHQTQWMGVQNGAYNSWKIT